MASAGKAAPDVGGGAIPVGASRCMCVSIYAVAVAEAVVVRGGDQGRLRGRRALPPHWRARFDFCASRSVERAGPLCAKLCCIESYTLYVSIAIRCAALSCVLGVLRA
jgi:hypothetical protein